VNYMEDPRVQHVMSTMPFGRSRVIHGGFEMIVDE